MKLSLLVADELEALIAADPNQKIYTSKRYYSRFFRYPYLKRFKMVLDFLGDEYHDNLLDIGFGSGIFLPELAKRCENLYGIDVHNNIGTVSKIIAGRGLKADLKWSSVTDIPYPENKFDCVICLSVLEFIGDINKAIFEINRVAKPNAKIIIGAPIHNKITDFSYKMLVGSQDQHLLHKSDHKKIIKTANEFLTIQRIKHFPFFCSINRSLFFVLSGKKKYKIQDAL